MQHSHYNAIFHKLYHISLNQQDKKYREKGREKQLMEDPMDCRS